MIRIRDLIVVHLATVILCAPTRGDAQPRITLAPSCASCRILITERVSFQAEWADGSMPTRVHALQSIRRTDWLVLDYDGGQLLQFDARGRYVGRFGREGSGPGEFRSAASAWPWGGDSVAILDDSNARISIIDPSGRVARTFRWEGPAFSRISIERAGGFVFAGRLATRSGFGHPFHHFGRDARLVESFGAQEGERVVHESAIPVYRTPRVVDRSRGFRAIEARAPRLRFVAEVGAGDQIWDIPMSGFEPLAGLRVDSPRGAEFFVIDALADGSLLVGMGYRQSGAEQAFGPEVRIDGQIVRRIDDFSRFFDSFTGPFNAVWTRLGRTPIRARHFLVRMHQPSAFRAAIRAAGFTLMDETHFFLMPIPRPVDQFLPRLTASLGAWLEPHGRGPLARFGEGFLVRAQLPATGAERDR